MNEIERLDNNLLWRKVNRCRREFCVKGDEFDNFKRLLVRKEALDEEIT